MRPTKMTEETVKKLLDWFAMWFSDSEACLYADISKPTLYEYCKINPSFSNQKEELKDNPKLKAKMNLYKSIEKWDLTDSKWYLERKGKDEFSLKQEIDQSTKLDVNVNFAELSDEELDKYILQNK